MNTFYENFGVKCIGKNTNRFVYGEEDEKGRHMIMTVFKVFSGIDAVLYNSFEKYVRNPGEIKESKREFYCISYYLSGVYESKIKKNKHRYAMPGSIDIIKNYNRKSKAEIKSDYMQGFSIMLFPQDFKREELSIYKDLFGMDIDKVVTYVDQIADVASVSPDMRLLHIAYELMEYLLDENTGMIRLKIIEFFNSLISDRFKKVSSNKSFSKNHIYKTKMIQEKMLYDLKKHYTIQELCKENQISETIFKECFKSIYQHTPYEFLRIAKMRKASELLKGNAYSISEIANKLGYENPSNFTRTFKAVFGILPKEYRKNVT